MPRRFLQNVLTTYAASIVAALQVLLVTPLLVHGLGPERYGIWALVGSTGLLISLLDLGLGSATTRYVAEYEALGERSNSVRTVAVSFWTLVLLGGIAFLVGAVLAPVFAAFFSVPGEQTSTSILVTLVAASAAITFIGGAFGGCLGGLHRYAVLNAFNMSIAVAQTAAFALVLAFGGELVALGSVLVVAAVAGQIARYVAVRRFIPETTLSWQLVERAFAKELLAMTAWISSAHLSTVIRYRIDTLVVGFVAGIRAAGVYAVGQLLFVAANRFVGPAVTGFIPFAAELAGRRDREGLKEALLTGTRITLALAGLLCLPTIMLAGPVIHAWVGPGFEDARFVVVCLVSALLLGAITRTGLLMLEGSGHMRPKAMILWTEATLNLALSVGLGLLLGIAGVALATLIATAAVSTAVGVPYVCRTFGVSTRAFLVSIARAHVPAVCAALVAAWMVYPSDDANILMVVFAAAGIALAYLSTLALTGLSGRERRRLLALVHPRKWRPVSRIRPPTRRSSRDR